jgi:uncharacterized membrane protein
MQDIVRSETITVMSSTAKAYEPPRFLRLLIGPLASRPRLAGAIALGVIAALLLTFVPNDLRPSTRAVLSWDACVLTFIVSTFIAMGQCDGTMIRKRAAVQDEGQHFILGLTIIAAAASIIAIGAELSLAKDEHGLLRAVRIFLAFVTVAGSWLFVQMVFALHYAHEFYAIEDNKEREHRAGLLFPGDEPPDYWDFLHFSTVLGVAGQTADVAFASRSMRRTGTVHGMVAFVFNTVVLALTINLLAGLF